MDVTFFLWALKITLATLPRSFWFSHNASIFSIWYLLQLACSETGYMHIISAGTSMNRAQINIYKFSTHMDFHLCSLEVTYICHIYLGFPIDMQYFISAMCNIRYENCMFVINPTQIRKQLLDCINCFIHVKWGYPLTLQK